MAAPMRDSSLDSSGHRGKVVDAARTTTAKTVDAASTNFEYDDNEWDIGIGDLIIDLDADIEKTNENIIINNNNNNTTVTSLLAGSTPQIGGQNNMASTGANSGTSNSSVGGKTTSGKMAIEHSATVDKGLKMKIKRTKPGTKTSEAKHEIVKSNEMNGNAELGVNSNNSTSSSNSSSSSSNSGGGNSGGSTNSTQGSGNNSSNSGNDKGNSNSGKSNSTSSSSTNSTGPITNSGSNSSLVVNSANSNSANSNVAKRGSSSHRRDKANRDKHGSSSQNSSANDAKQQPSPKPVNVGNSASSSSSNNSAGTNSAPSTNCSVSSGNNNTVTSNSGSNSSGGSSTASGLDVVNGLVRTNSSVTSSSQQQQSATSRSVFPASTGPGPPGANANSSSSLSGVSVVGPQSATSASTASSSSPSSITGSSGVTQIKTEQTKVAAVVVMPSSVGSQSTPGMLDDRSVSPPPSKKIKTSTDPKDMVDVCVGTSVGTITEPDCLGPCEPGTSVTLEGIVWHETEGGVLVVNVTWRGKTYVGTLLDCTRHDWAPPRFCDSPTSDLDARTPKGRGKRGRAAAAATTPGNDLSNFTETRSSVHSKLRNGGAKGRRGAASSGNSGNSSNSGSNNSTGTSSPTPFIPPRPEPSNKRKSRSGDDDPPTPAGKKSRVPSTVPASPVNASSGSPPASPVLLECPEPNCSKKYKHINGLKYHQSHAHGSSAEDDDTKDVTSMSENDESNIEAPSPAATPVKSPEKVSIDTTPASTPQKKDESVSVSSNATNVNTDPVSQPSTPKSRPQSPQTPNILQQQPPPEIIPSVIPPVIDPKNNVVVKPGVLRFGPQEDGNSFSTFANKSTPPTPNSTPTSNNNPLSSIRTQIPPSTPEQPGLQAQQQPPTPQSLYQSQQPSPLQPTHSGQPPTHQNLPPFNIPPNQQQPNPMQSPNHQKLPQFKVKPTAALMPSDDKKGERERNSNNQNKPPGYKKKSRNKSPAGSPHPQPTEVPQQFTDSSGGREDVQSPAYSDISDDTAPPTVTVLDNDVTSDKNKTDKKTENNSNGGAPPQSMPPAHTMPPQYGMYPFYGQSPYLVPSVQQQQQPQPGGPVVTNSDKGPNKLDGNPEKNPTSEVTQQAKEKDPQAVAKKDIQPEFPPQKVLPPHYYPQYGYMQGYGYNIESPYGPVPMQVPPPPSAAAVEEQKIKEERHKESPSPADQHNKPPASLPQPIPNPIQVPTPTAKVKSEPKEKQHQNENHQILKESIEMKNQMSSPYMYSRQQPPPGHQPPQSNHNHHMQQHHPQAVAHAHAHAQQQQTAHMQQQQQREEELRRYYLYPDQQRRKEALEQQAQQQAAQQQAQQQQQQQQQQPPPPPQKTSGTPKAQPSPGGLKPHSKDKQQMEEKKEKEIKQEGVKPTMETQGPPPPPTSQYAYIHPSYMQSPAGHYSAIPFDPNHPMYRSMLMHSPYAGNPYMHHPQIPRYHAPEDLSRGPPPGPTKALDILQHHANQYYTSHKIHELQERALKSPTPKTSVASSSPSANVGGGGALSQSQQIGPGGGGGPPPSGPGGVGMPGGPPGSGPQSCGPPGGPQQPPGSGNGGKQVPGDGKDSRSPPPQRHVHTHHHTHVGLGYPILAGQYPATYGAAAVLASQQAAAVTVINPYPPK